MSGIGRILCEARKKKKVSCSQAAAATRMKIQHIEALERDDFTRIAAPIYAKGFIRLYAEYLGLDPEPLLREYTESLAPRERPPFLAEESRPSRPPLTRLFKQQARRLWAWGRPRLIAWKRPLWIASLVLVAYLGWIQLYRRGESPPPADPSAPAPLERVRGGAGPTLPVLREPPDAYLDPSWSATEGTPPSRPKQ